MSDLFDKIRETKLFEVLTFHEEALTKDIEMDVDVNSVYLTICFWFKMNKYNEKKCNIYNEKRSIMCLLAGLY